MSQSRVMISRSVCDCSATTCPTARKANASNVSLLCSKADRMEAECTSSRNRRTVAASGSCVGCRFCHSKFFDALMTASNTRSEFMKVKTHAESGRSSWVTFGPTGGLRCRSALGHGPTAGRSRGFFLICHWLREVAPQKTEPPTTRQGLTATPDPRRKYAQSREGCGWEAEYPATKATVRQRQFEARQLVPPARKESPAEAGQVHPGRKIKMKRTLTPTANRGCFGACS